MLIYYFDYEEITVMEADSGGSSQESRLSNELEGNAGEGGVMEATGGHRREGGLVSRVTRVCNRGGGG